MKRLTIKLAAFLAIGCPMITQAHDQSGSLGSDATATDYYQVICSDDIGPTAHLAFQLHGVSSATAAVMSAQIRKGNVAMNVTDPVTGDVTSSREIAMPGAAGVYLLTVDKTRSGQASYSFTYHCQTASGDHTATDIILLQDQ